MPYTTKWAWRSTELDVVRALKELGCGSSKDIGAKLSLSHKWVESKLRILKEASRIYVADWRRYSANGDWRRIYALKEVGDETDVPKPAPLGTLRNKNYQRRRRLKTLLGKGIDNGNKCSVSSTEVSLSDSN